MLIKCNLSANRFMVPSVFFDAMMSMFISIEALRTDYPRVFGPYRRI